MSTFNNVKPRRQNVASDALQVNDDKEDIYLQLARRETDGDDSWLVHTWSIVTQKRELDQCCCEGLYSDLATLCVAVPPSGCTHILQQNRSL